MGSLDTGRNPPEEPLAPAAHALPLQALIDRWGPRAQAPPSPDGGPSAPEFVFPAAYEAFGFPWSRFLPGHLQVRRPCEFAGASSGSSTDGGAVRGRVFELARDPIGCRRVQAALYAAEADEDRLALAQEMRGHIADVARCPHGNHVLQACIVALRPLHLRFILDELQDPHASQVARHKYGSRIIQRLMERCHPQQRQELVNHLLVDIFQTSQHAHGTYVVQQLLRDGDGPTREVVVRSLEPHLRSLTSNSFGCAVLRAMLKYASLDDQLVVANALASDSGALCSAACQRFGDHAVILALRILEDIGLATAAFARTRLLDAREELRSSRFGRAVLNALATPLAPDRYADSP